MNETIDAMMRGRFAIVQGCTGHRAGLDAMLLQAIVPARAKGHLVDLGAGCGTVAFAALTRAEGLHATLIERNGAECLRVEQALQLEANTHLVGRVAVVEANVGSAEPEPADFVLANPPYNDAGMQAASDPDRRSAHAGSVRKLGTWQAAASRLLKPNGTAAFIVRPDWWTAASFGSDFGDQRLLCVRSRSGGPVSRIIVLARKGRRTAASILPDLVVHTSDGGFTEAVGAILEGRSGLFDAAS